MFFEGQRLNYFKNFRTPDFVFDSIFLSHRVSAHQIRTGTRTKCYQMNQNNLKINITGIRERKLMLPGRQLISEIENLLFDLDVDEYELSLKLEQYILDNGEFLLHEWHDIQKEFSDKDKREHLFLMFDTIQSEISPELEEAEEKVKNLSSIDRELDRFIEESCDEE